MDTESMRILVGILYYVGAYIVTGVISALLIAAIYMPIANKFQRYPFESRPLSVLIGIAERVLYTTAVLLGHPEFVAVWLAVKMAGEYKFLEPDDTEGDKYKRWSAPAQEYTISLIGNAFSLLLGIGAGYLILQLLPTFPSLNHWRLPTP
jgi:hypothetical protein